MWARSGVLVLVVLACVSCGGGSTGAPQGVGYVWTRIDDEAPGTSDRQAQMVLSVAAGGPGLVAAGSEWRGDDTDAAVWVSPPAG
jgi:hypothetical protein